MHTFISTAHNLTRNTSLDHVISVYKSRFSAQQHGQRENKIVKTDVLLSLISDAIYQQSA